MLVFFLLLYEFKLGPLCFISFNLLAQLRELPISLISLTQLRELLHILRHTFQRCLYSYLKNISFYLTKLTKLIICSLPKLFKKYIILFD